MATLENIATLNKVFLDYNLNWPLLTQDNCAFGGHAKRKQEALALAQAHQDFDAVVQGQYWEDGDAYRFGNYGGCSVGCLTHANNAHGDFPKLYGIPTIVALLSDDIFESLTSEDAKSFPVKFISAIPVGADLTGVITELRLATLELWYGHNQGQKKVYEKLIEVIPGWEEGDRRKLDDYYPDGTDEGVSQFVSDLKYDAVDAYGTATNYANNESLSDLFLKIISECVPA